jgi:tetratricopeptide (TPR) repeat protein
MKRTLSICLGLLAFSLLPLMAQQAPAPAAPVEAVGKVQGQVINPTGNPQGGGTVSLSADGGATDKFSFPVAKDGTFGGDAAPGTYLMVYRAADTPKGQMVDSVKGVKVVSGQTLNQNIDMSRQEFIDTMSPEQKKQLEELKSKNSEAMKANQVINHLNADLKVVAQDRLDIDAAAKTAASTLGAGASKADLEAKTNEIKTAKYTDIESLMTQDTAAKPDEALLWSNLGFAQAGLKKYDDAISTYKKTIDLETNSKKPRPEVIGIADAGLGEVYARTGKVADANAAYDASAKADPSRAAMQLRNEAVIFMQQNNADAQVGAANEAIAVDPNQAILYYIKGQGLIQKATMGPDPTNPKVQIMILPPDCLAAYQKYLDLAPTGPYAAEVSSILQAAGQKVSSSYKAPPTKK